MARPERSRDPQSQLHGAVSKGGLGALVTALVALYPEMSPAVATGALTVLGMLSSGFGAAARDWIHHREIARPGVGLWLLSRIG